MHLEPLLDQFIFKPKQEVLYIQDRNWLSQDSWVSFVCSEKKYAPKDYFLFNHFQFKWNVYLNVSYQSFLDRYEKRRKKSFLNKLLSKNHQYFEEYQQFCLSRIPDNENWIVINTDNLSPAEVVEMILTHCKLR